MKEGQGKDGGAEWIPADDPRQDPSYSAQTSQRMSCYTLSLLLFVSCNRAKGPATSRFEDAADFTRAR